MNCIPGNWQHLYINQENAQHIADLIHDAIRNGGGQGGIKKFFGEMFLPLK